MCCSVFPAIIVAVAEIPPDTDSIVRQSLAFAAMHTLCSLQTTLAVLQITALVPILTAAAAVPPAPTPVVGDPVCSTDPICLNPAAKALCDSAGLSLTHSSMLSIDAPLPWEGDPLDEPRRKSLSLASQGEFECTVELTCGAATPTETAFIGSEIVNA